MKKTKPMRVPIEFWETMKKRQLGLQEMAIKDLKVPKVKIKLADTFRFFSQKPVDVYPYELERYLATKKKRRSFFPTKI